MPKVVKKKKPSAETTTDKPVTDTTEPNIDVKNIDGMDFLQETGSFSVDLVLTDPPYITSRKTGMDEHSKKVAELEASGENLKTEKQWKAFKTTAEWSKWMDYNKIPEEKRLKKLESLKDNYIKYGSIYGKKYAVVTDYGDWDSTFTLDLLKKFIKEYYRVLRNGGTCIVFFDIWKLSELKEIMESVGFKQIRFIEWIKTNPQPLNSSVNYLTNCREIALLGVKKGKPTFNSKYDNGIYEFPLQGGKHRFHPTQKSLALFEELIKKHSNPGDIVIDTFMGSGTTARAAKNTGRNFFGTELNETYFNKLFELINQ
jgi:site-specific DNA-methyltransferase (adenine-specific)